MKNLYSRSLIFSLALIFVFAVAVPAQQKKTTTKKNTSSKTTKKAPVLKPGVTGANKTAKTAAKTAAAKTPAKAPAKAASSKEVVTEGKATAKADPKPAPAKTPVKITEKTTIKSKAPEEEEIASVPSKTWLPSVTADTIKKDISGRGISDIPSEASGDATADWLFAANQTRDIEILKKSVEGSELVVETLINAKKTKANADGTYDRLRGVARMVYRRGERSWELNRVENVSLRHGDTGMDNPVVPVKTTNTITPTTTVATAVPKPTPTPVPPPPPIVVIPSNESVDIPAGKYRSYSFRVSERAVATGRFQAVGGSRNDIEAYILDYDGFLNWTNDHGSPAYYNSGRMTVGNINTLLGPGSYYLVLNNRISPPNSPDEAKTVAVNLQLRMDPATLAGVEYGGNYNGAGLGSGARRVYLPLAAPAPSYLPDPAPDSSRVAANNRPAQNIPSATSRPVVSEVAGYTSESILSSTFGVEDRKFQAFAFTVRQGGMVKGSFRVIGGHGDGFGREAPNIEAFIMTADQYAKWSSYREATVNYTSGRVTNGGISRTLQPGNYYLVFSNYYSTRDSKTIQAEVHVEYLPK